MEHDIVGSHDSSRDLPRINGTAGTNPGRNGFQDFIGAHEIFTSVLWRAALLELIATAFLLFLIISCAIAFMTSKVSEPLLLVPFAIFINLFIFLMVMIPITGGHLNPFVTFIAFLEGFTPLVCACVYIFSQIFGSVLGFLLVKLILNRDLAHLTLLGGCTLGALSHRTAFALEFCCTFLVLLVGITVAFNAKRSRELSLTMVCAIVSAPMAVGVFISLTVTGKPGYSGVGLKSARCLGPAILERGPLWDAQWVFWIGPLLACIIYHLLPKTFPKDNESLVSENDFSKWTRLHFPDFPVKLHV
ncbi:Major intrinsic protein [Trema orientale]|uniref:Major intrinsic protein n=1 Tax=Trema orientale TaxID=63057 RepID=A0A2P5ED14_TREOI|nr:Major intrinsic protein [Trema orientale]